MKTLILAAAIAATNVTPETVSKLTPENIKHEFTHACFSGDKTAKQCFDAGVRIREFVDACEGGNKTFNECVTEALRREGV